MVGGILYFIISRRKASLRSLYQMSYGGDICILPFTLTISSRGAELERSLTVLHVESSTRPYNIPRHPVIHAGKKNKKKKLELDRRRVL